MLNKISHLHVLLFVLILAMMTRSSQCTPMMTKRATTMENGLQKESGVKSFFNGVASMFGAKGHVEPTPDQDPFYGFTSTSDQLQQNAPGTILRTRGIYLSQFPGFHADDMVAWQIAYVTRGQTEADAIVTVATVIVPPNAGDRSKIVFQAPKTDSAAPGCRTSYTLRRGSGSITGAASEQIYSVYLSRGWINVIVDYEGQHDAFGAGPTSGHSLLDAMRATLTFQDLKLAPRDKINAVGWGYSGGAIAVGWAAQMIETYAPDLQQIIKGWSTGGLPVDLFASAVRVNDGLAAGLIIGVLRGLSNIYPQLDQWQLANTNARGKELMEIAKTKCFFSFMSKCAFDDLLNLKPGGHRADAGVFTTQGNAFLDSIPNAVLEENHLGSELEKTNDLALVPKAPMFIYESIPDEVVPIETVDGLMQLWASKGARIQYSRVKGWLHVGTLFAMQSENVAWIADRMDGKPVDMPAGTLRQTDVDTAISNAEAIVTLGKDRTKQLQDAFTTTYKSQDNPTWW